ncbi:DUF4199 domain-containing protein [Marinicella meishanensis]|uniref:DUF4199 domain-containing protein n=1 Tax=Marinicella meishanensis TaxID=2873263 RepID=UPI001CBE6FE2|nr:DUF4199 domain-containing protein [Marinicella sp. NBU2979]
MKKIVLIHGLLASLVVVGVSAAVLWTAGPDAAHSQAEWLGYLIMIVGLSVIFVAVKQHRDHNLGGVIGFKAAFMVGLLITLITAAAYVIGWEVYYQQAGQNFMEAYQQAYLADLQSAGASAAELAATQQQMADFGALYERFYFRAFITLLEILPVGLAISVLCAVLLRTRSTG